MDKKQKLIHRIHELYQLKNTISKNIEQDENTIEYPIFENLIREATKQKRNDKNKELLKIVKYIHKIDKMFLYHTQIVLEGIDAKVIEKQRKCDIYNEEDVKLYVERYQQLKNIGKLLDKMGNINKTTFFKMMIKIYKKEFMEVVVKTIDSHINLIKIDYKLLDKQKIK